MAYSPKVQEIIDDIRICAIANSTGYKLSTYPSIATEDLFTFNAESASGKKWTVAESRIVALFLAMQNTLLSIQSLQCQGRLKNDAEVPDESSANFNDTHLQSTMQKFHDLIESWGKTL